MNRIEEAIRNGLNFLEKECENGFYRCYISSSREMNYNLHYSPPEVGSSIEKL